MAKGKNPKKKVGGPFLAAAVLCNSITEDSDGVVSAIRIVDEIRAVLTPNAPADFPSKAKPVELSLFALIIIRRGDAAPGKHQLSLVIERPDGSRDELKNEDVQMPDYPNGTATVKAKLSMKLFSQGTFWIDVILGKQLLTRMALNLVLQRAE